MGKKKGFAKFLAGIGLGAAVGVLFAPKTGSETRKELKKYLDQLVNKAKDVDIDEVKEMIQAKVNEIEEAIADLDKEKVLKIAKKKANEVKDMASELVNYAVEKGTPVLEETAITLREKAIDVTKEVLEKLEKTEEEK